MDHKIKPTATRIGIVNTWSTISYKNSIEEDKIIIGIIKKILLKSKFLISNVTIKKLPEYYIISYLYYPISQEGYRIKYRVMSIIKGILQKYLNKRIYLQVVEVPSIITNAEILAGWIEEELKKTPKLHKSIFKTVIKEYKKWSVY